MDPAALLRHRIIAARGPSWLWVAVEPRDADDDEVAISRLLRRNGLQPPNIWVPVTRKEALRIAAWVLWKSQAYGTPVMPPLGAVSIASDFLALFARDASHLVNGRSIGTDADGVGGPWSRAYGSSPVTEHTFDTAVIAIDSTRVGLLCIADED